MFRIFKKKLNNQKQKGMTLIELLVALVIFSIITGVVLFNYGDFNASLTMQNLADDIALTVRRAQSYAIGVRGRSGDFNIGYGVYFDITQYNSESPDTDLYDGTNKSFILYKKYIPLDSGSSDFSPVYENEDGTCDGSNSDCLEMLYITSSDYISEIKVKPSGEDEQTLGGEDNPKGVNILFIRPNPEPYICVMENNLCWENTGTSPSDKPSIEYVKIKISSLKDLDSEKFITISNTGQISVSNQDD